MPGVLKVILVGIGAVAALIVGLYFVLVIWFVNSGAMEECPVGEAGCGSVSIDNESGLSVWFEAETLRGDWEQISGGASVGWEGPMSVGTWLADDSSTGANGCSYGAVRAIDTRDRREVARHPGPLCIGDTWVLDSPDE